MNNWEKEFDKLDINLIINRDKTGNSMNLLEEYWKILKPIIKEELKNEFKPFIQDLLDKQKEEIKEKIKNMRKKEQCLLNDLGYHTKDCENCEYNSAISDILKELNK